MAQRFSYLLDKIVDAEFQQYPFKHIYIDNYLRERDFAEITSAPEVAIPSMSSDEALFDQLFARGYKILPFPGCIADKKEYIEWHVDKENIRRRNKTSCGRQVKTLCEGFGVTLRLATSQDGVLGELREFLDSVEFNGALAAKFQIAHDGSSPDAGLQKYLDGYEIPPHPDVRRKALTYMVNINPHRTSEDEEHHTHYLTFKPRYKYVEEYWRGHPEYDRSWVPWGWCETISQQRKNNSIVVFSPSDNTLHAVKANYDHLKHQRTQLYGNLWYPADKRVEMVEWEDLQIEPQLDARKESQSIGSYLRSYAKRHLPRSVTSAIKTVLPRPNGGGTVLDKRARMK
jgi:hypothetical protein